MGKSIREVYGTVLAELGDTNENIVVLDADLSGSTKSGIFAKAHPERHFNMGIAESDMVATAAGLSTTGKIPFVNTFTVFLTTLGLISARAQVCYGNLNVKFGGAYCGMSDALDGATHHATEDIAVMRSLPNMTVLVPSDAASTRWATKYAVDTYGPMYLRLSRDVYPDLYDENTKFECGKGAIVRDGTDVTVIACGILVHKALEAAEQMAERGVSVRVVDMYSIKPIDRELILRCAQETGAIVTAEEHNIYGGLGSAVAEVLAWGGAADGGVFARKVGRVVAQAGDQAGNGRGEQEVAGRALLLEDGQHLVHVIGQAEHVRVHGPGPVLRRMVVDPAGGGDAGVGEHQVELAVLLHDAQDAEADLFILRDVGLDGDDLRCAGLLADGLGLLEPLGVDVDEGEAHAALGGFLGEGAADAGGGAGDGGNFVLEFFHVWTSFL